MKKIGKYKYYILSFLIPFLVLLIFFLRCNNNFYDLLIGDAGDQYIYFFDYFKGVLDGEKSLFYSFSSGLGGNFFSTYLYYLSSPLNFFLIFIPYKYIHIFFGMLVFIKIGLCGLTMFIYLMSLRKENKINSLLFSISYALTAYNIVYYFNIMWLDIVFLTPLVILGIDNMISKNKSAIYIFFLSLSIFSNFYISWMLCIFCVFYFFYKLLSLYSIKSEKKIIKKKTILFLKNSFLSGLICSVVIIPLIFLFSNFYRTDSQDKFLSLFYFFNFFSQMGIKHPMSSMDYYLPFYHCNFIVFSIIINYLYFKKNDKKKKLTISLLLIFLFSICFEPFSLFWHAFSKPNGLLFRFVFLFDFVLILIANDWIAHYHTFSKKDIFIISLVWLLLFCSSIVISNQKLNILIVFINLFFLVGSLILLNKNTNKILIILFILLEIIFSLKNNFLTNYSFEQKYKNLPINERFKLCGELDNLENSFYRVDHSYNNEAIATNSNFNCNSSGVSLFLTTNNKYIFKFLKKTGYYVTSPFSDGNYNLLLMNSILGIRYYYDKDINDDYYKEYKTFDFNSYKYKIYKNENALSLGFSIKDKKNKEKSQIKRMNSFEYQNYIFSSLIEQEAKVYKNQILRSLLTGKNKKSYAINIEKNNNSYFYIELEKQIISEKYDVYIDNKKVSVYSVANGIIKIDYNEPGTHILTIEGNNNLIKNVKFYSFNDKNAQKVINILKKQELNVTKIEKNVLIGNVNVTDNNEILLLTIPYEKGWKIKVDGEYVKYSKILDDTFIGVKLNKGIHKIEMRYYPIGFFFGLFLSTLSIICLILKKISKKYKNVLY